MTQSNEFETGDIVRLKSGGPEMTVRGEDALSNEESAYWCQWFAGKKLESGRFPAESIERVKEENKK